MEKLTFEKVSERSQPDNYGEYIVILNHGGYAVYSYINMYGEDHWRDENNNIADEFVTFWLNPIE